MGQASVSADYIGDAPDGVLPADDLDHLEIAFNMLGRHRYGGAWGKGMARRVRLGHGARKLSEHDRMARWALKALTQCVENGWLPLFYFVGEQHVRRVEYYRNPDGFALHALYPKPTDDGEAGGQIELTIGDIHPCMVDIGNFVLTLQRKFGAASKRRGPKRSFLDFDAALDKFYEDHPTATPAKEVIDTLRGTFKGKWPGDTVMYERIAEAAQRALDRIRSTETPEKTPDG
jgi:hypothetical protein